MITVFHRVNTSKNLLETSPKYGVEVDVRPYKKELILSHEPYLHGELLVDCLKDFHHSLLILDLKSEWIARDVIKIVEKARIQNYFLLGLTIPETMSLVTEGFNKIAVRFSEVEPIMGALEFTNQVKWVWVDTFTKLPLDSVSYSTLKSAGFNICLVCPERWGRPEDIKQYQKLLKSQNVQLDAVMTSVAHANEWEKLNTQTQIRPKSTRVLSSKKSRTHL